MPWNGTGTYLRVRDWTNDASANINMEADLFDSEHDSIAEGINTCLTKDGQNSPTANLPMAGFKHSNVGASSARNDYAQVGQVQDGSYEFALSTGSGGAYTLTLSPPITTYVTGQQFRFKANHANSGAATLAVSALAAKDIKLDDGTTALSGNEILADAMVTVVYDGTVFRLVAIKISAFGRSLIDDSDASAARTTLALGTAAVKNTGTSGDAVPVLNGAATSWSSAITVQQTGLGDAFVARSTDTGASSGPDITLDRDSATPAAADRLGNVKFRGNDSNGDTFLYSLIQGKIVDPTVSSEDGGFWFQTVVAGTMADRFGMEQGFFAASLTDPGTGKINASGYSIADKAISNPVLQVVQTQTGAVATGTTTVPIDDSIPQNTEGDEYMTLAITPKVATSKLKIEVTILLGTGGSGTLTAALFQDSTADALAAAGTRVDNTNSLYPITFVHYMTSGTTSATTFKVRAGASGAGTTTFNGVSAGRLYGGVAASSITITEHYA
jgi:hypothetical protein